MVYFQEEPLTYPLVKQEVSCSQVYLPSRKWNDSSSSFHLHLLPKQRSRLASGQKSEDKEALSTKKINLQGNLQAKKKIFFHLGLPFTLRSRSIGTQTVDIEI
jgi:hypothetical protein